MGEAGLVAAVSLVTEAVQSLVARHENVSTPADVLAVDGPAAVLSDGRYVLACDLDLSQATANVERLSYKLNKILR